MKDDNQAQKIERIILDSATVSVVKTLSDQINMELGDLVQVTQKSVANFILRKRSQSLSAQEMSEFLSENYDLIKALKHATQEAIKAKHNGGSIEIGDVLKLIQTPSVKKEMVSIKRRGRKKKAIALATTNDEKKPSEGQTNVLVDDANNDSNSLNSDSILKKNRPLANPDSP